MTVGELKALLAEVPDDWPVAIYQPESHCSEYWDARRLARVHGYRGAIPSDWVGVVPADAPAYDPDKHPLNCVVIE